MNKIAIAAVLLSAATSAHAQDVKADARGLTLEAGPVRLNLGGRIHADAAVFDDPAGPGSSTEIDFRRARLELSGKIGDAVRFRVDREFAGESKGWRNVWLGVSPVKDVELRGGNMMVPFSTEDLQSSNSIPFAERSLASALSPGYGLGGAAAVSGKRWSASLGWFTDALSNEDGRSVERGKGAVGRVTILAADGNRMKLHFGLGAERRNFGSNEDLRLSADAGSAFAPSAASTGTLRDIRHLTGLNGEVGLALGPVLLQGQAMHLALSRPGFQNLSFNGQIVQAAWLVTGGRYGYARGTGNFSGPDLKRRKGAVELALRYSRLDLQHGSFDRGTSHAVTGAVNWYLNGNIRLLADFTRSRTNFAAATPSRTNNVGVVRVQLAF